ncbi:MAG: YebC/PmpR family DNA-binding transcriptional regulator [Actinomycetota bacterium]
MSGHSKWATTKHRKAAVDAKRGKLFARLIRGVEVAAREGGGNIGGNPTLADWVAKARDGSVPMDTIERAIKRGTGELEGVHYEHISFEGYASAGVAIYVESLTDNRNRAVSAVRSIFSKHGGNLGDPGCVAWMFERKGLVLISREGGAQEDELLTLALEAGAEDLRSEGDTWEIVTLPGQLGEVRAALDAAGVKYESAETTMIPTSTVEVGRESAGKVVRLVEALEDCDDVQDVYANFDIPDEVLAEID